MGMMRMVIMILDKTSASLKGELTRWMLEPKSGVFIGNMSAMVREKLWKKVLSESDKCEGATMFYSMNTEQGYDMVQFGKSNREIIDFDGLKLIKIPQKL